MPLLDELRARREEIYSIAAKYGIDRVRVFGSVARGEETALSDVDFLVHIGRNRSLLDLAGFQQEMEEMLQHKADVVSEHGIYHLLRDETLGNAVPL